MSERVPVCVYATDPLSQAGIAAQLRSRPEVLVVDDAVADSARVGVVVADDFDAEAARVVKSVLRNGCPRVVVVVTHLDDTALLGAVEAGACGFVRRTEAVPERLAAVVQSAADGDGTVPPDLLGRLLDQVRMLHQQVLAPRGFNLNGLSDREITVLRLVADGLDTVEIANQLYFSERTVKNIVHDVTARFKLRNRTHAVVYAVRLGLI